MNQQNSHSINVIALPQIELTAITLDVNGSITECPKYTREKKENHHKRAMKNDFYDFYLLESHGQGVTDGQYCPYLDIIFEILNLTA